VSGSADKTIKIWNVDNGECLKTLKGHNDLVWRTIYSPDGKYVISGSNDKTIKIWNVESGECLRTLEGHTNYVMSVDITLDG
jgi:WD40 repeat protein